MALTRRQLLASMAAAGGAGLMPTVASAAIPSFSDYKALVCFTLYGGNDAFNTVIPLGLAEGTGYDTYAGIRGTLAIGSNELALPDLHSGNLATNPYDVNGTEAAAYLSGNYPLYDGSIGLNPVMPELAQLAADGKAATVLNMGTLVRDTIRADIKAGTASLPPFLYAHNQQLKAQEVAWEGNVNAQGWVGRLGDLWSAGRGGVNGSNSLGLGIAYGNSHMLRGLQTTPLVLSAGRIPSFYGMMGTGTTDTARRNLFTQLAGLPDGDYLRSYLTRLNQSAMGIATTLDTEYPDTSLFASGQPYHFTDSYGLDGFAVPDAAAHLGFGSGISSYLLRQLESVATMADIGKRLGMNRQVFTIALGGFDTHSEQDDRHPRLLRAISLGMWKFQLALQQLGMENEVTTFTMSDFGRTMTNNGDGTDHAWGAHHFVVGGAVQGGKYGEYPDVSLDGIDDSGNKGRFIPTTPLDQYYATLAKWFGLSDEDRGVVFPNIGSNNYTNTSNDLGFMG